MSDADAPVAPPPATNGTAPGSASGAPPAGLQGLPEGTIQLPPAMVARLTRLMQENPVIHDVLYAFIEGREATGTPLTLVVPLVLLVPPQAGQGG